VSLKQKRVQTIKKNSKTKGWLNESFIKNKSTDLEKVLVS
jgi:hypothetical protein